MAVVSCPECVCDVDAENLDELLQCAECHYQFFHVPPKKQSSEIPLMKTTLSEGKNIMKGVFSYYRWCFSSVFSCLALLRECLTPLEL